MGIDVRDIQARLLDMTVDGAGLYMVEKAVDYARLNVYSLEKTLKQYTKPALLIGISMADLVAPNVRRIKYVGDWLALTGKIGMKEAFKTIIDKPPYVVLDDANTIHGYNFDNLTNLEVWIDGVQKTSGTDYTVSGTADDFTISLTTALASGEHDILISDGKKAWYGKVKV